MLTVLTAALLAWAHAPQQERDARLELNRGCMGCHVDEAAQWLASPHAGAFVDGPFQAAHAREPRAFCRACHAPEQAPSLRTATAAAGVGVACVSCHLDRDRDAAALLQQPGHPALGRAADCGGCHEFDFPDAAIRHEPLLMQRTMQEHAVSPFAGASCESCHMREHAPGRHDHTIAAARDSALLERALDVVVERTDRGLRLELRVLAAGHAVPTGDLFRRLEVGATVLDVTTPRAPALRWLSRRFDDRPQANAVTVLMEIGDDRVPADGSVRVVELVVPDGGTRPIAWWVEHQRVAFPRGNERHAPLDGRMPMAGGIVPAPG